MVLLGDFNVNLNGEEDIFNNNNSVLKDKLIDSLPIEGYSQVVRKDTRHGNNTKSLLIDHI